MAKSKGKPARPLKSKSSPVNTSKAPYLFPRLARTQRYVIGIHACLEVLRVRPEAIEGIWMRPDWVRQPELKSIGEFATRSALEIQLVSSDHLAVLGSGHQGVCLLVTGGPSFDYQELKRDEPQILMLLDSLEDPHNLGAIMRTAWLMGVKALVLPNVRSVGLTPVACKVASGAAEHLPLLYEASLPQFVREVKEFGFWAYALDMSGETPLWQAQFPDKVVWMLGSEANGLRGGLLKVCDQVLSIPQQQPEASYNASVAAAMALYEVRRQHQLR